MKFLKLIKIKLLILLFLCLSVGCGSVTSGLTGTSGSNLTDAESNVYETGNTSTFDLPVTIAKLKSVDIDKLTVTHGGITTSSQLRFAGTSSEGYTFVGDAGAADTSEASFVMLVSATGQEVAALATDGSFTVSIAASEGDTVAILLLDSTQANGSPAVYTIYENGETTFMLTNSNLINTGQNILVKDGNAYFSLANTDGTYAIYQKPLNGTAVDVVAENITSKIRYIDVDDNANITYVTQDGNTYMISATASASISTNLTTVPLYATLWASPIQIHSLGYSIEPEDRYVLSAVKVFYDASGNPVITSKEKINSTDTNFNDIEYLITIYDVSTGETLQILPVSDIFTASFAQGDVNTLWVSAVVVKDGPFKLFKLDLRDGASAWDNRVLVYDPQELEVVAHIEASENNLVLLVTYSETVNYYMMDETLSEPLLFGSFTNRDSAWMRMAPESTRANASFVTCVTDSNDTSKNNIVIHRTATESYNEFYRLTNSDVGNACSGILSVDLAGHISFYQAPTVDGSAGDAQLSIIRVNKLDSTQLVLVDPADL